MTKTRLYIARHGKTMFNTIGRAQGWSDTPLTKRRRRYSRTWPRFKKMQLYHLRLRFQSDSGRTMQTIEIILRESENEFLPYTKDNRIREWCFGSLEGTYDSELFLGVLPRTKSL